MKPRRLLLRRSVFLALTLFGALTAWKIYHYRELKKFANEYAKSAAVDFKNERNIRIWNTSLDRSYRHEGFRVEGRSHGNGIRVMNSAGKYVSVYKYRDYVYVSNVTVFSDKDILFVEVEGKEAGLKHVHELMVFDLVKMRTKATVALK